MPPPKARILVIEDDPAILQGLLDVLVFHGYAAEGLPDGALGLETAISGQFDLVLLDVMLPSLDGFEVCRRLRAVRPAQALVMLTAKGAEEDIVTGLQAGADDYVCKPFSLRELLLRVEAVLRRSGRGGGMEEICCHGIRFCGRTLEATFDGRRQELTRREMDLVAYLHRHRDRIVSKKELLVQVWRYADADIETRTVDIHVLKLRKKLATLAGERPLIVTVRGEGYRLEPEP